MTRKLILILTLLYSFAIYSQKKNCGCDKSNLTKSNIFKCDTTIFTNGAKLYWQSNCDSSCLTFENKVKRVLKTCKEINELVCDKAGLFFLKEYPSYLLFEYKWISGCCDSPDIIFYSKEAGLELNRISKELFVWVDIDKNYLLYFSDTTYNSLICLNHYTDIKHVLSFDKGKIIKSLECNHVLQLAELFENFREENGCLTFNFKDFDRKIEQFKIDIN